jgi:hypothetical protein
MNGIEIIILFIAIIIIAGGVGYFLTKGQKSLKEFKTDFDNNTEVQELKELAEELYNKDLRPITAKKTPKKEKVIEIVPEIIENTVEVTPEVTEKVVEITPEAVILNVDAVLEEIKEVSTVNVDAIKPKKKRKYYPKKKK